MVVIFVVVVIIVVVVVIVMMAITVIVVIIVGVVIIVMVVMVKLSMLTTFQCISSLSCKGRDDKKEEGREHLSPGQQYSEQLAKFKSLIDKINLISYQF